MSKTEPADPIQAGEDPQETVRRSGVRSDLDDPNGQVDRLWSHVLYVYAEIVQRGNFYLLGESMLVVAYSAIMTAGPVGAADGPTLSWMARVVGGFGMVLAAIWLYAGHSHWLYVRHLRRRATAILPEYRETWEQRPKHSADAVVLLTYAVPAVTALMWLVLIVLA